MTSTPEQDLIDENVWAARAEELEARGDVTATLSFLAQMAIAAELHQLNRNIEEFLEEYMGPRVVLQNVVTELPEDFSGLKP